MPLPDHRFSRRRLLRQFGLLLGCTFSPPPLLAQAAEPLTAGPQAAGPLTAGPQAAAALAPDGFRLLRAAPGPARPDPAPRQDQSLTYDGASPGPALRVRRGDELKIRLVNALPEATTIHWHGLRLPNAMDGAPPLTQPPVDPGASFDYRFAPPDAGTFWYHASAPAQRARGLAGVLIVDEAEPAESAQQVGLPELTLTFQDALQKAVDEAPPAPSGTEPRPANDLVVNGTAAGAALEIAVFAGRLRLRLVNASLQLLPAIRVGSQPCWVMAIDGEPAQPFRARDSQVALGPGNRLDLFVDLDTEPAIVPVTLGDSADGPHEIARLLVRPRADRGQLSNPPPPLPANPLPERMDFRGALKMDVALGGAMDAAGTRPLFSIARGRTGMLALVNRTDSAQAVHLHGHHFRLLDRLDDGWKPFWLDTILVPARETQRIDFVADNLGKWLIDAHPVAQAVATPAGWFEVR